ETTNLRKAVETPDLISVPNQRIADYVKFLGTINTSLGLQAEEAGVLRRNLKGEIVPFKVSVSPRLLRNFTEDGFWILRNANSAETQTLIDTIAKLNPEMSPIKIDQAVRQLQAGIINRRAGMLEFMRKIPVMPDQIFHKGKKIRILRQDPYAIAQTAIRIQSSRIALIKVFGQGLLTNKGFGATLKSITKLLGTGPHETKISIISQLVQRGYSLSTVSEMKMKELRQVAKAEGILTSWKKEQYLEAILGVSDINAMSKEDYKKLQKIGKKLGGFDITDSREDFLTDLQLRLTRDVENKMKKMRDKFNEEGGNPLIFDRIMNLAQGIPYKPLGRNPIVRGLRFFSSMIGTAHVSQAAIPNLLQPAALVPTYTGHEDFARATINTLINWKHTEDLGFKAGAYEHLTVPSGYEEGYTMDNIARAVRSAVSRATLLQFNLHKNNVITAEAFRLMTDRWQANGIREHEKWMVKDFNLTEEEVKEINSGKMTELTRVKIIQQGVAKTQFITQSRYKQGHLTNNPLVRELLPYQSYGSGTLRATVSLVRDVADGVSDVKAGKSPEKLLRASKRFFTTSARFAGVGVLTNMLRQAITQGAKDEDETWTDKLIDGFIATQFLGPTTRMLFHSNPYSSTTESAFLAMLPKVKGALDFFNLLYNTANSIVRKDFDPMGKYGKLKLSTQALKLSTRHFGAWRTVLRWMDNTLYPSYGEIMKERRKQFSWLEKNNYRKKRDTYGAWRTSPKYFYIKEALRKSDVNGAIEALQEYREEYGENKSLVKLLLRAGPIPLKPEHRWKYLRTLSEKEKNTLLALEKEYRKNVYLAYRESRRK
ncbi:MAG: hypothetical protein ACTSW7_03455, partial [Candidatus Thorarchaeota archaeon]